MTGSLKMISKAFEKAISEGVFPGAVFLCALRDRILFHEAYGLADCFEPRPMQKDSIFDLASLTKPLATTLAVSRLMEQGVLRPETRLSDVLPAFRNTDKAGIAIDMLLRHTSGLAAHRPYHAAIMKSDEDPKTHLFRLLLQEKPEYPAGTRQVYSDLGFMILARVVEHISGRRLDRFVSEDIYRPLGIRDLFFVDLKRPEEQPGSLRSRFVSTQQCPWRKQVLRGVVDDDNAFAAGGVDGHAGLFGDAGSVWRLCREILRALQNDSPRVLSPVILRNLAGRVEPFQRAAGFDSPSPIGSSSGRYFSCSAVGHLGFTGTSFWMEPESGWTVILLTNRVHPSRNNPGIAGFRPLIHDLAKERLL